MPHNEAVSEDRHSEVSGGEYIARSATRHRPADRPSGGKRLRKAFFAATALWGGLAGTAGVAAIMGMRGTRIRPGSVDLAAFGGAMAVAIVGGLILAGAYEEAKRRRR